MCSVSIDDALAQASPLLGRMRLDGLTDTPVPFEERVVLHWRRGAPSPDLSVDVLKDVLKVWYCLVGCSQALRKAICSPVLCPMAQPVPFPRTLPMESHCPRTRTLPTSLKAAQTLQWTCLLYTSPSPRD